MRLTSATQDVSKCMNRLGSTSCSTRTKFNGDGAIRLRKLARGPHRWGCSRLRVDESTGRSKTPVCEHTINLLSELNYNAKWKSGNFAVVVHNQRAGATPLHAYQARRRVWQCVVRYGARALGGEVLWSGEREREVRLRAWRCSRGGLSGAKRSGAFRSLTPLSS